MKLTKFFGKISAVLLTSVGLLASPAAATPIAAVGTTDVTVSQAVLDFLGANSITPSPIDPATASGAVFSFPISGGDTNPFIITHTGGLRLEGGGNFIEATDFVIDVGSGLLISTISGSSFSGSFSANIFELANVQPGPPIQTDLVITSTFNAALGSTFAGGGDPGLTGVVFGTAMTNPVPVPLPATLPLIAAGVGALVLVRRRRKAASA